MQYTKIAILVGIDPNQFLKRSSTCHTRGNSTKLDNVILLLREMVTFLLIVLSMYGIHFSVILLNHLLLDAWILFSLLVLQINVID